MYTGAIVFFFIKWIFRTVDLRRRVQTWIKVRCEDPHIMLLLCCHAHTLRWQRACAYLKTTRVLLAGFRYLYTYIYIDIVINY